MKQHKELPSLIEAKQHFRIIIPENVESIIRHLCSRISDVEWSGVLFYKSEGLIENNDLVITCRDIFPMDIGNSTYTEFDMSPDVIGYMAEHPELLDCHCGLIHSHNRMQSFFSGTDLSTLREEGNDRNHFVSLIVNNAGQYTAAITRKIEAVRKCIEDRQYKTFEDLSINLTPLEYDMNIKYIEYYMLDIEKQEIENKFEDIDFRLEEIRDRKNASKKKEADKYTWNSNTYYPEKKYYNVFEEAEKKAPSVKSLFEDWDLKEEEKEEKKKKTKSSIPEDALRELVLQIITGNILVQDKAHKLDVIKLANSMPTLCESRFGKGDGGLQRFSEWATLFLDYAVEDFVIKNTPKNMDEGSFTMEVLSELSDALSELPTNRYLDEVIIILKELW